MYQEGKELCRYTNLKCRVESFLLPSSTIPLPRITLRCCFLLVHVKVNFVANYHVFDCQFNPSLDTSSFFCLFYSDGTQLLTVAVSLCIGYVGSVCGNTGSDVMLRPTMTLQRFHKRFLPNTGCKFLGFENR